MGQQSEIRNPKSEIGLDLFLGAALIALVAGRFLWITLDAPGGIVSWSGALMADEGGYLKAAKLYHTFGALRSEHDLNWGYVAPLFTGVTLLLGGLFRDVLVATRYACVASSAATMAVFYKLCRVRMARTEGLICCLLVATALDDYAFSRVAFVEPFGNLLSILALWPWVVWRGRRRGVAASAACGMLALWCKLTFVYAVGAVALLWAWEAWAALRQGRRSVALGIVGTGLGALCVFAAGQFALMCWAAKDAAECRGLIEETFAPASVISVLGNEAGLLWTHLTEPWRQALAAAAILGLAACLARGLGFRFPASNQQSEIRNQKSGRPLAAMSLWLALGLLFFGLFDYQPPRWVQFTIFPAAYLVVSLIGHAAARRRVALLLLLLGAHVAAQGPAFARYAARQGKASLLDSARDIARRLDAEGRDVAILGEFGHVAALYGDRIRPLSTARRTPAALRQRVDHWRPTYFVGYWGPVRRGDFVRPGDFLRIKEDCGGLIKAAKFVASYRIMENYYKGSDMFLLRLEYQGDTRP
ncbi:MAG: hypothetical protein FJ291_22165 [Planctomycetes bacterium]|nr:hypothetical protein [Planctomycetota bacterium]